VAGLQRAAIKRARPKRAQGLLLSRLGDRNKIAGNLTNEIEKLLTGFDLSG
jgi:hypothetical protein